MIYCQSCFPLKYSMTQHFVSVDRLNHQHTLMIQSCQIPSGSTNFWKFPSFLIIFHTNTLLALLLTCTASFNRNAEIRFNAGFRFVANLKIRGRLHAWSTSSCINPRQTKASPHMRLKRFLVSVRGREVREHSGRDPRLCE